MNLSRLQSNKLLTCTVLDLFCRFFTTPHASVPWKDAVSDVDVSCLRFVPCVDFTFIEKRDESSFDRMERTLKELKIEINTKYNMTDDDFERFVNRADMAVVEGDQLDWTFLNSRGFVFAASLQ